MTARRSTAWTFAITSIALFMVALDNLVVTTALPVIRADLGASLSELEWMVNAYTLTFAVLLLTGAALGDRFGRRRMFVIGLAIFTAGSAAAALAPSSDVLILARAVQGVGGAIVTPLSLTILSAAVPPERRARRPRGVGRHRRPRHRDRPARRRRHRRGRLVALDLLAQRADRHRRRRSSPYLRLPGVARPGRRARPARPRPRERRPARRSCGASSTATTAAGPTRRSLGALGDRRGPDDRASSIWESRTQVADAAAPLLPQPRLHRRQRRLVPDVLRRLRRRLPPRPVLPGRPGPEPVPVRPADAAMDGDAGLRRARSPALLAGRIGGRPILVAGMVAAVGRSRLDRRRRPRRPSSTWSSCRAS